MINKEKLSSKFFEIRPGLDSIRYLISYSFLTILAKKSAKREYRLFTEITSNIDRHILSEGLFEKGVIDLLRNVIAVTKKTNLLIDIGANIGNHTVSLANLFKEGAAVEPHPVLYRILTANVIRNNHGHITCHNFGLASEDTKATLAEPADNHSIARVKERSKLPPETFGLSSSQFGNEHSVELRSAYAFFAQFGEKLNGAFVKIDVEGMEEEIVTAIAPLLTVYRPLVGFEWFTSSQPGLTEFVSTVAGYELWGIRVNDTGKSLLLRAIKMIFLGRSYELVRIDVNKLDEVYPLALLVPEGAFG
jgi:FkbM family methyltransferase